MAYNFARTIFATALLIYNVQALFNLNSFVSSRKSVGNNIPHGEVLSRQFCFLGARNMKTATCKIPHTAGVKTNVVSGELLPPDSICEMNMGHCIQCHDGLWKRLACSTALTRRTKRSLWFLDEEVDDCKIFCGSKATGFDNLPPVFQSCESPKSPLIADEGKTNTIVTWSPPTAHDSDGNTLNVRLLSGGGRPGDIFERGHHQFVYEATSDSGLASHCYVTFEVKVQICPVPLVPNGNRTCDDTNYMYGTTCQFSCNEGYEIRGSPELLCQRTGTWSQPVPTCARKSCPPLPSFTCSDDYNFGSVCEIICNYSVGLSPSEPSTYCLGSGEWKQPLPVCIDTSPPTFNNCPLRNVVAYADMDGSKAVLLYTDITAGDNVGNVTVTRTAGPSSGSYLPVGTFGVTYKAEDSNGNVAECEFNATVIAPRCSRPPYTDPKLTYTCNNDYFNSSACSIGCSDGYTLIGTSSVTCQADSTHLPDMSWVISSGQQPSCQKPSCPALNVPKNGNLTCDSNSFSQFCVPACKAGWDFPRIIKSHSALFSCGSSGDWLPYSRVPDCTVMRISEELRLKSRMYYFASSCQSVDEDQIVVDNLMTLINNTGFYSGTNCSSRSTCSLKDLSFTCESVNRRKRDAEQAIEIVPLGRYKRSDYALVVSWDFSVLYHCGMMTVADCVTYHEDVLHELRDKVLAMVDNGSINSTGPGFQIRQDSYRYDYAEVKCGEGMLPVTNTGSCAVCPTGTMYNSTSVPCVNCPKGSYQDTDHSFSCKSCPPGTTTIVEGAWSDAFCKVQCQAGWVSPNGIQPCFPCAVGEYQSSIGSTTCEKCPVGTTTERIGSTNLEECLSFEFSIIGPSSLHSDVVAGNLSDVTFVAWVKVRLPGAGASLSFGEMDLLVRIGQEVTVEVNGQSELTSATLKLETWTHICVTFKQNTQALVLYIDGQESATKSVVPNLTTIIKASSKMNVTVGSGEEISVRSFQLLNRHVSAEESQTMASTCALTHEDDTVISMESLKVSSGSSRVNIISPSSCDAVDDCVASPCNGHMCINTPTGYECQCQNGYTGSDCSVTPDFCINHQCKNEATCISGVSAYTCFCNPNYKGVLCEFEKVNGRYSDWNTWSPCSLTCGEGNMTRTRICDNPVPDADGIVCAGPNTETRTCNTEPCPVCRASDLQLGYSNTAPDCSSTESGLNCTATCHVGYFTSNKQISDYTCRNGVWSPSVRLPPCIKIFAPKSLEMTVEVNYTNQGCPTEGQAAELKNSLISKLGMTQCQSNSNCASRVVVPECAAPGSVTSAFSYYTFPLPDIDLDLDNYVRNKIVSTGLAKVIEAINLLEMTAAQLQNTTAKLLEVTTDSTTYKPIYPVHIATNIICPRGTFPEDGFCGECPPGTRYSDSSQSCVMCGKGSFQAEPGSFTCDRCPERTTTQYAGSSLFTDCSGPGDSDSQPSSAPNDQTTAYIPSDIHFKEPNDTQTNIALIIGCVLGALVLVAILLLTFVIWKRKNPRLYVGQLLLI